MRNHRMLTRSLATLAVVALAACGSDDATSPDRASVAGVYHATTFTASVGVVSSDVLAKGGSVTLTLNANGSATGHLVVPATVAGTAFDQTLNGTWSLDGNVVHLKDDTSDTFLEDLALTVSGSTLTGSDSFSGVDVHVVLTKQS